MRDLEKLKQLGIDIDFLPHNGNTVHDCMSNHFLKGYKKFDKDYINLLSSHSSHLFGVEDEEKFKTELMAKYEKGEKDETLFCALLILSIYHRKKEHAIKGVGHPIHADTKELYNLMENYVQKSQEIYEKFPKITSDIMESVFPNRAA